MTWVVLAVEWYLLILYMLIKYFALRPVPKWLKPFEVAFDTIAQCFDKLFAKFDKR